VVEDDFAGELLPGELGGAAPADVDQLGPDVGGPAEVGEVSRRLDGAGDPLRLRAVDPEISKGGVPGAGAAGLLDEGDLGEAVLTGLLLMVLGHGPQVVAAAPGPVELGHEPDVIIGRVARDFRRHESDLRRRENGEGLAGERGRQSQDRDQEGGAGEAHGSAPSEGSRAGRI
jgi:hypothetical protein